MKGNETYSKCDVWEQPVMPHSVAYTDTSEKGYQEYVHNALVEQIKTRDTKIALLEAEIEAVKKDKADFDELKAKYDNLLGRYDERDAECYNLRKEVQRLEKANKALEQKQEPTDSLSVFPYVYETQHFNKDCNIPFFFDQLLKLCNVKVGGTKYLIANKASVAPIFLVIKNDLHFQDTPWQFLGTEEQFVDYWNENVVSRICDIKRKEALHLNVDSFHTIIHSAPFKGKHPQSWENLLNRCRNKQILKRAVEVRSRMKQLFL